MKMNKIKVHVVRVSFFGSKTNVCANLINLNTHIHVVRYRLYHVYTFQEDLHCIS